MTQQGETQKKPGSKITTAGVVVLVLGVILLVMNLATTHVSYVPGLGTVEKQGTPGGAAIMLIVVGVVLAGVGVAKRLLASR